MTSRSDTGELRHPRAAPAGLAIDARLVDRHADHLGAHRPQQRRNGGVTGILHPDTVPRVQHQTRDEIERGLRAGGDHDLIGGALHTPRQSDVLRDGRPQWREPERVAVSEEARNAGAQTARGDPTPCLDGKRLERRHVQAEGVSPGGHA